jgi:FHS family glucose/mannose:H+ symporter-like MFS transporter
MTDLMNRSRLFGAACSAMFLFGIVLAMLGTVFGLEETRDRLHVDLAQQGDIFLALFLGVFLSTVLVGPVIDRYGNKIVLATSALLVAAALVLFSMAVSFAAALIAAFPIGFGGGGLNTAANALVADLYRDDRGAMLNAVGIFFGFGALVLPLFAATLIGVFTIPQLLLGTSALAAACAAAYLLLRFPPPSEPVGFSLLASVGTARNPGVLLLAALLFFQSGGESSIGGWTSTYIGSMGAPARTATMILAGYWASMMIGRLAAAALLRRASKARLLLASGIGSIAGCAVLLASTSIPLLLGGAIITGFSHAAIYPTTLAIAADRYQRQAGTIFGFLFAVGLIGGMLFPFGIGHISQSFGVRAAMFLPLAGAATITLLARRI